MKRFLTLVTLSMTMALFSVSCQKENNTLTVDGVKVTENVVKSFETRYPNAQNVMWEQKAPYWVAHFDNPATKAVAADPRANSCWFDNSGNWQMSEEDLDYEELPAPVKTAFEQSKYADWDKDDIQTLSRDGVISLYVIEVENPADEEVEFELYYTADGVLTKEVPAEEDHTDLIPEDLPQAILDQLSKLYPEYVLSEAEYEEDDLEWEVELISGKTAFELTFDKDLQWISTEYDTEYEKVPAEIKTLFETRLAELLKVEKVDLSLYEIETEVLEDASGLNYEFEVEPVDDNSDVEDIEICINAKGEVTLK